MGEWIIKIAVLAGIIWVMVSALKPNYVFEIQVGDGPPDVRKGKVIAAFLDHVSIVCQEHSITRGWVAGVRMGKRISLRFSRDFPPGPRQRLRNYWQLVG